MTTPTIRLNNGETAVIGYGSLLSAPSINKSLGSGYQGPIVPCHIMGLRRSWDASMPNQAFYYQEDGRRVYPEKILYLNVRPQPESLLNGVLFVLNHGQIEAMDHREWIYDRLVVTDRLHDVQVQGGEAIIYVAKEEHLVRNAVSSHEAAIRASYLRICEQAMQGLDQSFRLEYEQTTDRLPTHLVIDDHLDPDRPDPWASAGHDYDPASQLRE